MDMQSEYALRTDDSKATYMSITIWTEYISLIRKNGICICDDCKLDQFRMILHADNDIEWDLQFGLWNISA